MLELRKYLVCMILALITVLAIVMSPGSQAKSSNPCASCHSASRYQYLDILEGNSGNQIPASIGVGETKTVTVVIQNQIAAQVYNTLVEVSATLSSQNGHFSVGTPTISLGTMNPGTKTATWQITGVSAGSDALIITARGTNPHNSLLLTDSYAPSATISVTGAAPPPTYTVTVTATDSATSAKLQGASVALGDSVKTTDASGAATFATVAGTFSLSISKAGYTPLSESITVTASTSISRSLKPELVPPPTYTVFVTVIDSTNSSRLVGANVTLGSQQQATNPNGVSTFTVQAGTYPLEISKAGYNQTSETLVVGGDLSISRSLTPTPVAPRYVVAIRVSDAASKVQISGANVTFGGVTQVTSADGVSSFTVLSGTYQLEIVKVGYDSWSETVPVNASVTLSRVVSATPPPPATDLNPFMAFIYPPLSVTAFVLVYAFAAYILAKKERTPILNRLGFMAWIVALIAMIDGVVWGRTSTTFFAWVPDPTTMLSLFVLISATMILFGEGWTMLSKLLAVVSCVPAALILPYYFGLVSLVLLILVTAFRFDAGPAGAKSPQVVHRRMVASKLNRVVSWLFLLFSAFSLSTGYIMTRLNLDVDVTFQIHELLGYTFAVMLVVHVLLTLLAGYPWKMMVRNFLDRRTSWSVAMFLQVVTALLLVVFSGAQVLTGLGWAFPTVASIVPILPHIRIDELLFSTLVVHGAIGVKFALTRRRIKVPRIDYILVLVSVVAIALVFLYGL